VKEKRDGEESDHHMGRVRRPRAGKGRGLRLVAPRIRWPEYPVPEEWHVLRSPNRVYNRNFYEGREDAIRRGEYRVPFGVLWARGVEGEVSLGDLTGSEGGPACDAPMHDSIGRGRTS
jgi:hypothetical protein